MTILPKKKASQSKNDGEAKADHGPHNLPINHSVSGHSQTNDAISIERLYGSGQNSPSCWSSSATREEKRPAHSAVSCFDEYETLDTGSGHSKRRLKASPHRSVRNKLRDRDRDRNNTNGSASPVYPSTSTGMVSGGNCSPIAGPSFFNPEDVSGYNSGDEYGAHHSELTEDEVTEKEKWFEKKLRKKGLCIKRMEEDGACLFRAVADQVYGDQDMHPVVRSGCMDYMHKNSDYFSHYVTEDFNTYINRKRLPYVHGNHIEMQAMSEMFNRPIEVYCYRTEPINTFCGVDSSGNEPIRLSYHQGTHYNSIVDPFKATIGVGLGLPGLVPGMADKNLIKDAVRQSEDFHIEKAMLEDKLKATDWEATNEAIEEQIARESYLQWLRDNEKRNRNQNTRSSTVTSSEGYSGAEGRSPRRSGGDSPSHESEITKTMFDKNRLSPRNSDIPIDDACASSAKDNPTPSHSIDKDCASQESVLQYPVLETASVMTEISPDIFGLNEWEDADVLARVLAASQQEYLDSLKKSVGIENSSDASSSSSSGNHGSSPRPNS